MPRNLPPPPDDSTVPDTLFGQAGIDLKAAGQLDLLRRLKQHSAVFRTLREKKEINVWGTPDRIANGMFHTPDAEIYAGLIMEFAPSQIVEIGSGFSTRIARVALDAAGNSAPLIAVDPQPRCDVQPMVSRLLQQPIEDVDLGNFDVAPGSILFIDSSHICRTGGDLPRIFCQILPSLPPGVLVHVHDIFIPYDYPVCYQRGLWNEQYLLHALLSGSRRFEVVLASHFLSRFHPDVLRDAISPDAGRDKHSFGASFWFRTTAG